MSEIPSERGWLCKYTAMDILHSSVVGIRLRSVVSVLSLTSSMSVFTMVPGIFWQLSLLSCSHSTLCHCTGLWISATPQNSLDSAMLGRASTCPGSALVPSQKASVNPSRSTLEEGISGRWASISVLQAIPDAGY